ncbi:MAG: hypothetical protein ACM30H_00940 [Clostridia bacterium]
MKYWNWIAAVLALVSTGALATPKVAGVTARQVAPLEAQVTVTIERPTPIDMLCDTTVDLGDGTSKAVNFGMGDKHQKTLQHKYAKPGTYKIVAKASGKCEGMREASLEVSGGAAKKSAAAVKPLCPRGWSVVADSQKGASYSCQANAPSSPIKCEGGTKYFAEKGLIGCR